MMHGRISKSMISTLGTLAVAGVVSTPAMVWADDAPATVAPSALTEYSAAEQLGLKPTLDSLNMKVYGWLEQSYVYNFHSPTDNRNQGRIFDTVDGYRFNQLALNIERTVSSDPSVFDIGGKVQAMYGHDAALIHSQYLFGNTDTTWQNSTDNLIDNKQFDPTQFYVVFHMPVGNGLNITVGKFATTLGYEVIDAPGNALFSRSFLFGYAIPFTHTGVKFDYNLTEALSVYYGVVFGWDTFGDTNGNPSHMFGATWKVTDKVTWVNNLITGPEQIKDSNNYRTVYDTSITYAHDDNWSFALNADWGNESGPSIATGRAGNNWYGFAGYATYKFNEQVSTTLRAEYFRDETASRTGFTAEMIEVTYGFDIKPLKEFANLRIRPEFRWDHALSDDVFDAPDAKRDQFTLGFDVIVTF